MLHFPFFGFHHPFRIPPRPNFLEAPLACWPWLLVDIDGQTCIPADVLTCRFWGFLCGTLKWIQRTPKSYLHPGLRVEGSGAVEAGHHEIIDDTVPVEKWWFSTAKNAVAIQYTPLMYICRYSPCNLMAWKQARPPVDRFYFDCILLSSTYPWIFSTRLLYFLPW